jgi:hypothetical protein
VLILLRRKLDMKLLQTNKKRQYSIFLYSFVFSSVYVKTSIALLFVAFLVQPVAPAFANTGISEPAPESVSEVEVMQEPEPVVEVVEELERVVEVAVDKPEEEVQTADEDEVIEEVAEGEVVIDIQDGTESTTDESETVDSDTDIVVADDFDGDTAEIETVLEVEETEVTASSSVTNTGTESELATTTNSVATLTAVASTTETTTRSSGGSSTGSDDVPPVVDDVFASSTETATATSTDLATSSEDIVLDEKILEVNATSSTEEKIVVAEEASEETVPTVPGGEVASTSIDAQQEKNVLSVTFTNDDNRHQFAESECVDVGDGAFYCSKKTDTKVEYQDGVYAEKDIDGDREIFLKENGNVVKITDNEFEDGAPSYDKQANQIVFHRLIEGRYQVMRFDIASGTEQQLTVSHENNMEPTQVDGVVVWQRWVVDNWEVALLKDGKIRIITDNSSHDVAPTIRDGYAMWHTTGAAGEKLLSVYDIENDISSTIADPDGGHVENPRFVLVYDTKFENGDTITKEYDPKTGEIKPIGSTSAPTPREIPPPDATGEVRALVGMKTTTRDDGVEEFDDADIHTKATTTPATIATSSVAHLPVETTEHATTTPEVIPDLDLATTSEEVLPLTDFDIIVEPYTPPTTDDAVNTVGTTSSASEA